MSRPRVRIDDRLLHSEVLYGSLAAWHFDHIVVASALPWLESVDPTIVPGEIRVTVTSPSELSAVLVPDESTLIVLGTVTDLEVTMRSGLELPEVILANRAVRDDSVALSPSFFADPEELAVLRRLSEVGVRFLLQRVPSSEPIELFHDDHE
jgi:mannose/fructose/N-acetylgalactosamine-specific phosphotransferase system component IIB